MRNLKVIISFRGTNYHGFQRQENAVAVQNILEEKLSRITNAEVQINGCSRTDTGVHANEYCFSFETEHCIPCENIVRAMNSYLPSDIAVKSCEEMIDDFHARYSCSGKEYEYLIYNNKIRNPFYSDLALFYPYNFDFELLQKSCSYFVGKHDFKSFCNSKNDKENTERTIEYCYLEKSGDFIKLKIKADGFLYNMIRIIVGTLIEINEGHIKSEDIPKIILSKDRNEAGKTALGHGLYLNKIFYEKI